MKSLVVWLLIVVCPLFDRRAICGPPTVQQVEKSLVIARRAADAGLHQISQQAVRRALAWGPPRISETSEQFRLRIAGARADTSSPLPVSSADALRQQLPGTLLKLTDQWLQSSSAEAVYETLKAVVLPQRRPDDVCFYAVPLTVDPRLPYSLVRTESLADRLIETAIRQNQIQNLLAAIAERSERGSAAASLLAVLAAQKAEDIAAARSYNESFRGQLAGGSEKVVLERAAVLASDLLLQQDSDWLSVAADLMQPIADVITSRDRHLATPDVTSRAIMLLAARCQFAAGRSDAGIVLLRRLLELRVTDANADYERYERALIVGRELYLNDRAADARLLLGTELVRCVEIAFPELTDSAEVKPLTAADSVREDSTNVRLVPVENPQDFVKQHARDIWLCRLSLRNGSATVLGVLPDFQHVASLAVRTDQDTVLLAATRPGEIVASGSRIYICSLKNMKIRELGPGIYPSWSPGGNRLVCSRYSPMNGVWLFAPDGTVLRRVDADGWAGVWTGENSIIYQDRKSVRFWRYESAEDRYYVADFSDAVGQIKPMGPVYPSPDMRYVVFKGRRDGRGSEAGIFVLSRQDGRVHELYHSRHYFSEQITWTGDSTVICFSGRPRGTSADRLMAKRIPTENGVNGADESGAGLSLDLDDRFHGRAQQAPFILPGTETLYFISKPFRQ